MSPINPSPGLFKPRIGSMIVKNVIHFSDLVWNDDHNAYELKEYRATKRFIVLFHKNGDRAGFYRHKVLVISGNSEGARKIANVVADAKFPREYLIGKVVGGWSINGRNGD